MRRLKPVLATKAGVIMLILFSFASRASAYIDPGTGVTFVSGLGGLIAGVFALLVGAVGLTFKKWIGFFLSLWSAIKKKIS